MGTFSESNGDRSGLGEHGNHKNEGCVALSLLTQKSRIEWREQDSFALGIESP